MKAQARTMKISLVGVLCGVILFGSDARAQIESCGTNGRGDSVYCGNMYYTNSQGGMFICNCSVAGERCVNDPGQTGLPLCTSTSQACGSNLPCTGYSTCVNGSCCQPQTKSSVCGCASGLQPDGCGGQYNCGSNTCVPLTLGISNPIVYGHQYEVQLWGGPPNTAFSLIYVGPDNTNYPNPATSDSHGNWAQVSIANVQQFPQLGTWGVQAQFTSSGASNYATFTVSDHFPPVPSPAMPHRLVVGLGLAMAGLGFVFASRVRRSS